jgi:PAS domain S-box-containing protein
MTDKINFLKFFFDSGKYAEPSAYSGTIADFVPALVFAYRLDLNRIQYVNKSFSEYFGLSFNDIREGDDVFSDLICTEDIVPFKTAMARLTGRSESKIIFQSRLNHKNGETRPFRLEATVLKQNSEGEVTTILFVAQDVSDELRNREEIGALKGMVEETEEILQFGSWTLFVRDNSMTWSSGLMALLDYRSGDLATRRREHYLDHVVNGYKDALAEILEQAICTRTDFEYEYVVQTCSAHQKTVYTKGKIVLDDSGNVEKIIGITRDITTLRNFEKDQERHIRQLNKSNKELEEFAYIASHDLQEPIRKISMFGERLRLKFGNLLDDEGALFLNRILASSANMKSLIDNLLEFSRANRSSGDFSLLDLTAVFEQVLNDLELKIEETQSAISVKGTLPKMEAVSTEMKQLFTNLLSNAIKFRKKGQLAKIDVVVRKLAKEEKKAYHLQAMRSYYKIDITDNGVGFEEEYADKIFQVFHRLHGKSEYPGSGIGLAICKKIVENHNGIIFAHSLPDEGATFTVILPEKQF